MAEQLAIRRSDLLRHLLERGHRMWLNRSCSAQTRSAPFGVLKYERKEKRERPC